MHKKKRPRKAVSFPEMKYNYEKKKKCGEVIFFGSLSRLFIGTDCQFYMKVKVLFDRSFQKIFLHLLKFLCGVLVTLNIYYPFIMLVL